MTVMWQVRLWIRATRPRARARQRFSVGPSSTYAAETYELVADEAVVGLGVRDRRAQHLLDLARGGARA